MGFLMFILCVLVVVILWIAIYDSNRFVIRNYTIANEKINRKMRIVFVSDLHNKQYGPNNERLAQAVSNLSPELLVIGGDMINGVPRAKRKNALDFLDSIKDLPLIYANGNHEHRISLYPQTYGTAGIDYEKELCEKGIHRLINEHKTFSSHNLIFYGSQIEAKFWEKIHTPKLEVEDLNKDLGECDHNSFSILLAHKPDFFPVYKAWGADLVLSGHVHGGIVRIPGGKGILSPNIRFFPKYDGGIFEEESATMIVSRGLGIHTIPFRLFNPGEIVVIELTPKEK